jgi:hypothetical protein
MIREYKINNVIPPTKPNSSIKKEKIKSVSYSGRKLRGPWVPLNKPLPRKPPEPIAIFD